jgi:hypothetical protein
VVIGSFELEMSEFQARKAVESPEDFAMSWRDHAALKDAHGPGCRNCGIHAREGLGHSCEGPARLERLLAEQRQPASDPRIALPGRDF